MKSLQIAFYNQILTTVRFYGISVLSKQKLQNKIGKIQERCLWIVLNDYLSNYADLLQSCGSVPMEQKDCVEDYDWRMFLIR